MSKNISQERKTKKNRLVSAGTATLVLGIIGTVVALFIALGSVVSALIGVVLMLALVFIILVCSVCTAFIIWASDGFRNFINKFWEAAASCFGGAETVKGFLQTAFPYIVIVIALFVIAGFVVNLIGYLKNKDNKKQKSKFIAMTILFGISIALIIIGALVTYL